MMTRFLVSLAVVACACLTSACGGTDEGPVLDACVEIEGQTYLSIDQYTCGVDNDELCNWSLYFAGGNFDWTFDDLDSAGSYTCDGPMILGNTTDASEYDGYIDADTGVLTWNQIDYQLAP